MRSEAEIKEAAALLSLAMLQGIDHGALNVPDERETMRSSAHMLSVLLWCLGDTPRTSFPDFGSLVAILKPAMEEALRAPGLAPPTEAVN